MSLYSGISWTMIPLQFTNNLPMLLFLSMLPWMASAFSIGEYDQNLKDMVSSNSNQLAKIYGKGALISYSLVVFINISAVYLVQKILMDKLVDVKENIRNDFIIMVTLRAFALAVIWSPMEIMVGITIDATGVSFFSYLPWLVSISILVSTIDIYISKRKFSEIEVLTFSNINKKELVRVLTSLVFVLGLFFTIILASNKIFELNFILTVSLAIFPFTLIWSIFMKRAKNFLKYGFENWKNYNNNLQNFVILLLSLALFSEGFNQTNIPHILQLVLGNASEYAPLIFIFITIIYFSMALLGVHPVATIAILIEVLNPLFGIINPMSLGIVLIVSALATTVSSPYGINATLSSQNLNVSPFYIMKLNLPFSIFMGIVGIIVATILI